MPSITADLPTWNFRPGDPPEYRKLGKTWFVAAGSLLLSSHRSKWWNHFAQPHQDGLPSLLHSILHTSAAPCWKILCDWFLNRNSLHKKAAEMHQHIITKTICQNSLYSNLGDVNLLHSPLQRNCLQFSTYMCPHTNSMTSQKSMMSNGPSGDVFPTFIHTHIAWNHFLPTLLPAWPESGNCQLRPGDAGN